MGNPGTRSLRSEGTQVPPGSTCPVPDPPWGETKSHFLVLSYLFPLPFPPYRTPHADLQVISYPDTRDRSHTTTPPPCFTHKTSLVEWRSPRFGIPDTESLTGLPRCLSVTIVGDPPSTSLTTRKGLLDPHPSTPPGPESGPRQGHCPGAPHTLVQVGRGHIGVGAGNYS